jgi:hypothetical protein
MHIGETFVDGLGRDVWCDSKIPITNTTFFQSTALLSTIGTPTFHTLCDKKLKTQTSPIKVNATIVGTSFICL